MPPPPTHTQELRVQEQSLEKMKLQLGQWDEILREKERKLQEWVSTREAWILGKTCNWPSMSELMSRVFCSCEPPGMQVTSFL